ncbi:hypothetical protein [Photobacterium atrarenae]|uniref:4-oxalocrotonate tautomerase domain-containing protein n=1 Tax=Photobacterium atrarenae TaxID=865757 RepID=A0ABY5GLU2_9GAMM|nr:hypothetical protein [Photobacterium atrarenae]UTV29741.1 hypothetical protein NNL38_22285 [Photobacterium atrarenae]
MPLIRIKSLPFAQEARVTETVTTLSQAVSDAAKIPLHHIMITWEYLPAGHFAHHGKVVDCQPEATHPLLVDLIAPNFNTEAQIAAMLELIAHTIAEQVPVEKNNIFINFTPAYSDGVYDEGHVVEWDL